ncbi:MAG: beta-lysine N6-acetyltransferase [Candidatus Sumerlaeota bacterium]|nr:beta-lysine N6-acetyltransferase [Candidatus Sumerlaeota bacterium]
MNTWHVELEDGRKVELDAPFGHEHTVSGPGYSARVLLSPINCRIQVYGYEASDIAAMTHALSALARRNSYGKLWVKAPAQDEARLADAGFVREGGIAGYFDGADAAIMALFTDPERRQRPTEAEENDILAGALKGARGGKEVRELPTGYRTALFEDQHADALAALYKEVFPTYPYPIDNPDYLVETAHSHILYRLVWNEAGELVAAASAETSPEIHSAEMTDFASRPSERGKGLAQYLLRTLEADARERFGIRCYYTIARALSFGMLRTFHNAGYELTGTLVNNCNIAGKFETMHLMCRPYEKG